MRLLKNILKILAALVVVLTIAVFLIFQLPEFRRQILREAP